VDLVCCLSVLSRSDWIVRAQISRPAAASASTAQIQIHGFRRFFDA
jgi:hypothetical protein